MRLNSTEKAVNFSKTGDENNNTEQCLKAEGRRLLNGGNITKKLTQKT